jgi:hypothetical protein
VAVSEEVKSIKACFDKEREALVRDLHNMHRQIEFKDVEKAKVIFAAENRQKQMSAKVKDLCCKLTVVEKDKMRIVRQHEVQIASLKQKLVEKSASCEILQSQLEATAPSSVALVKYIQLQHGVSQFGSQLPGDAELHRWKKLLEKEIEEWKAEAMKSKQECARLERACTQARMIANEAQRQLQVTQDSCFLKRDCIILR